MHPACFAATLVAGSRPSAVLCHLRIRDPLHAAEHGVEEDDGHADADADVHVDLEESSEDDADAAHLTRDVRERDEDRTRSARISLRA